MQAAQWLNENGDNLQQRRRKTGEHNSAKKMKPELGLISPEKAF